MNQNFEFQHVVQCICRAYELANGPIRYNPIGIVLWLEWISCEMTIDRRVHECGIICTAIVIQN